MLLCKFLCGVSTEPSKLPTHLFGMHLLCNKLRSVAPIVTLVLDIAEYEPSHSSSRSAENRFDFFLHSLKIKVNCRCYLRATAGDLRTRTSGDHGLVHALSAYFLQQRFALTNVCCYAL